MIPAISAVLALFALGVDKKHIVTDKAIRTTIMTKFCQVKIVSVNGIVPLILYNAGGIEDFVVINRAGAEERPKAQILPSPRYPAAPIAL